MRLARAFLCVVTLAVLFLGGQKAAFCHEWPQRPKLEDFQGYAEFTQAMNAYRQYLRPAPVLLETSPPASSTLTELSSTSPEMLDPLSEDYPPPLNIVGPEDLDVAVEQARSFIHPVYKAQKRYNRSTSQSFALAPADAELLEGAGIGSILFGQADPGVVIRLFLEQDDVLSAQRAGDYSGRLMDESGTLPVTVPILLIDQVSWMHALPGDVRVESFSR